MSQDAVVAENAWLKKANADLTDKVSQLQQQLDWFKRQLFGQKSEKRLAVDPAIQQSLFDGMQLPVEEKAPPTEKVPAYERRKKLRDGCATDSGLRFDETVPVKVVDILPDELKGEQADHYEILSYKITYRLAQQQASYLVIEERRPVFREKQSQKIVTTPAPARVLDNSVADVSFLAGMLVDKFQYHLPLYRQHQRLVASGITVSRGLLTQLTSKAIKLLKPIVDAQHTSVLQSKVLAIDETPIKAGRKGPGKMKKGYLWPMYGDRNELVFCYCPGRSGDHLKTLLDGFGGTLLTDGYQAYERFVEQRSHMSHAQCWAHTRRGFEKALKIEPEAAEEALALIGKMYDVEAKIRERSLTGEAKRAYRQEHSRPVVEHFWAWCDQQCHRLELTPTNPLSKALNYAMARVSALEVFLDNPDVAIDTNHLERGLRCIPMGKKNWLFCWTEAGGKELAIIQSLIATCRLHQINPYVYLVDVLQRVSTHPARDVHLLTPRLWKEHFADKPLKSVLERDLCN